jgi:hypothetical protein
MATSKVVPPPETEEQRVARLLATQKNPNNDLNPVFPYNVQPFPLTQLVYELKMKPA